MQIDQIIDKSILKKQKRMELIYIETSAVNYFLNNMNGEGAEATRKLQLLKGREWCISTTVMWELQQIPDRKDLDACLFLSSFLFHDKLLKSAAELSIDYIEAGMPHYQVVNSVFTNSVVGEHWNKSCNDRSHRFMFEGFGFTTITENIKKSSRYIRYLADEEYKSIDPKDDFIESTKMFLADIYSYYYKDDINKPIKLLRKISMVVMFLQLCMGFDITKDVIDDYWHRKNIDIPIERLIWLVETHPNIIKMGPFWNIANVIYIQAIAHARSSRGALHDGLHAIYLPFIDAFLTNDNHFRTLRERSNKDYKELYYSKVYHLDEAGIYRVSD